MKPEFITKEQARFNALSQDEANKIADNANGASPAFRSCWYCNEAHERLKDVDYLICFICGIEFVQGYPVPVLGARMRGDLIDDSFMDSLVKALEDKE